MNKDDHMTPQTEQNPIVRAWDDRGAPHPFATFSAGWDAAENLRAAGAEPVAWRWQWKDLPDSGWQLSSVGGWRETDAIRAEPLYLAPIAPQPALDAADLAFIADELRQAGKNRAADLALTAMAYPTQPA